MPSLGAPFAWSAHRGRACVSAKVGLSGRDEARGSAVAHARSRGRVRGLLWRRTSPCPEGAAVRIAGFARRRAWCWFGAPQRDIKEDQREEEAKEEEKEEDVLGPPRNRRPQCASRRERDRSRCFAEVAGSHPAAQLGGRPASPRWWGSLGW